MLGFDSGFRFPRLWKRIWKNLVNINFLDCIDFLIMNSSEENRASKKLHRGLLCLRRGKKKRKKKRKNKKPGLVNTFHITFHTKRADCVCFSGSNRKDLFTGGPMMDVGWSACSLWLFDDCPAFSSVKTGAIMSRGLLPFFTEIVFWSPGKKIVLLTPPPNHLSPHPLLSLQTAKTCSYWVKEQLQTKHSESPGLGLPRLHF